MSLDLLTLSICEDWSTAGPQLYKHLQSLSLCLSVAQTITWLWWWWSKAVSKLPWESTLAYVHLHQPDRSMQLHIYTIICGQKALQETYPSLLCLHVHTQSNLDVNLMVLKIALTLKVKDFNYDCTRNDLVPNLYITCSIHIPHQIVMFKVDT